MKTISASGEVLNVYQTGDRPVLLLCADGYHYVCKYKMPGGAAYKLVNELVGSVFAKTWGIATPPFCFVTNDSIIWRKAAISHDPLAPLFGSRKMENVFDLSEINCDQIKISVSSIHQLLRISLFDFWLSNEDRTCNNYNLLYDLANERIVSIDYGGLFNSGISGLPLYQLNESDSILSSELYDRMKGSGIHFSFDEVYTSFIKNMRRCRALTRMILDSVPRAWNVDMKAIENRLSDLFTDTWVQNTWDNFVAIASVNSK